MLVACLIVLAVLCLYAAARLRGLVYLGRTLGGWTSVHDDRRTLGERIRVLDIAGTYQSATYLDERWCDPVFPYHQLFDHFLDAWPAGDGPASIAILGGGGYALPRHIVAHMPQVHRIDVVELDPAIERIARQWFFLNRLEQEYGAEASGRLQLHVDDALRWLEGSERHFDAILNDCFLANEPEASLLTAKALRTVREHLTDGGIYLTNVVASLEGPESALLYTTLATLGTVFDHVWLYPCGASEPESRENNVVVATNASHHFADAWSWPPASR